MDCWSSGSSSSSVNINWLVTDQLGTPRMIFDKTGALANVKRHDYAPFGEELFNGARTTAMGYAAADSTRQKFTSKERDSETGLDFFTAHGGKPDSESAGKESGSCVDAILRLPAKKSERSTDTDY